MYFEVQGMISGQEMELIMAPQEDSGDEESIVADMYFTHCMSLLKQYINIFRNHLLLLN